MTQLKTDQILLRVILGIVVSVAALVALAVAADHYSQTPERQKARLDEMEIQAKREAQIQKCTVELWPAVNAAHPYDGKGADPLTGKSWQDQHMREISEIVKSACAAGN